MVDTNVPQSISPIVLLCAREVGTESSDNLCHEAPISHFPLPATLQKLLRWPAAPIKTIIIITIHTINNEIRLKILKHQTSRTTSGNLHTNGAAPASCFRHSIWCFPTICKTSKIACYYMPPIRSGSPLFLYFTFDSLLFIKSNVIFSSYHSRNPNLCKILSKYS